MPTVTNDSGNTVVYPTLQNPDGSTVELAPGESFTWGEASAAKPVALKVPEPPAVPDAPAP